MEFYDYDTLIKLFSKRIKDRYFMNVALSEWKCSRMENGDWIFGKKENKDGNIQYHIKINSQTQTISINADIYEEKNIRNFHEIFYAFEEFLRERNIDCFICTETKTIKEQLKKRYRIPMSPIGSKSRKIQQLLQFMIERISGSELLLLENQTILFHTKKVPDTFWNVHFLSDGSLEIENNKFYTTDEIEKYFHLLLIQLKILEEKEQELIRYAVELHPKNYYDPFTNALVMFRKYIPFSIQLYEDKEKKYNYHYSIQFGNTIKKRENANDLMDEIKKKMVSLFHQDRLRATIEGRI